MKWIHQHSSITQKSAGCFTKTVTIYYTAVSFCHHRPSWSGGAHCTGTGKDPIPSRGSETCPQPTQPSSAPGSAPPAAPTCRCPSGGCSISAPCRGNGLPGASGWELSSTSTSHDTKWSWGKTRQTKQYLRWTKRHKAVPTLTWNLMWSGSIAYCGHEGG